MTFLLKFHIEVNYKYFLDIQMILNFKIFIIHFKIKTK